MTALTYFKLLATLMKKNPPPAASAPMIAKMAKIGIVPGKDFDIEKLDPAAGKALERGTKAGLEQIMAEIDRMGQKGK